MLDKVLEVKKCIVSLLTIQNLILSGDLLLIHVNWQSGRGSGVENLRFHAQAVDIAPEGVGMLVVNFTLNP